MKSIKPNALRCPYCGGKGVQTNPEASVFKCKRCGGYFDADPDEGGTHYNDPTNRIERSEWTGRWKGRIR